MTDHEFEVGEAAARAPRLEPNMTDAAEMLWVVLANVSGGDWTKQSTEWQDAAARWRDNYFAALKVEAARAPRLDLEPLIEDMRTKSALIRRDDYGNVRAIASLIDSWIERLAAARSALPPPLTPRRCFKCDAPATHVCRHPRGGGLTALADAYFCAPCSQTHAALHACLGTLEPLTALPRVPEPDLEPSAREQQIGEVLRVEYLLKAQYGIHHDHLSDLSFLIVEVEALRAEVNTLRAARAGAEAPRLTTNDDQAPRVDHSGS